jgi:hypothetical protein
MELGHQSGSDASRQASERAASFAASLTLAIETSNVAATERDSDRKQIV